MIITILAATGGIMLGAGSATLWGRQARDRAGRFARRGHDWVIDLAAWRLRLRKLGSILMYMAAGWVLAFAVMLWGASG